MYEKMTDDFLRERMLARVSDKLDKRPSALIYDTHEATANELAILYIELEYLVKNSYGDTAAREFLTLLCRDRGITPEPASRAVLKGVFEPDNIDVTGKRFNIGDINYTVMEQIAPGQYRVECESEGVIGNRYLGQMIPMDYIRGLNTAELVELLIPGEDEEDTEALRKRYFDSFNEQAFGGNRTDYAAKVKRIPGIGAVKVTRVWNGDIRPAELIPTSAVTAWYESVIGGLDKETADWLSAVYLAALQKKLTVGGTVLVTVANADDFGEAGDVLLNEVQSVLDPEEHAGEGYGLAPIGHVVTVKSAEPVEINVSTTLTFEDGYGWNNLEASITGAVDDYLLELRSKWADSNDTVVRISQIESRILSVQGVADIKDTKLNGNAENVILGAYEIPVTGGVGA